MISDFHIDLAQINVSRDSCLPNFNASKTLLRVFTSVRVPDQSVSGLSPRCWGVYHIEFGLLLGRYGHGYLVNIPGPDGYLVWLDQS